MNKLIKKIVESNYNFNIDIEPIDDNKKTSLSKSDYKPSTQLQSYSEHEYETVDFDLPSGTLWCKKNLGAKTERYYGKYYSWGELEPKESYYEEDYKYYHVNVDMSEFDPKRHSDFAKRVEYEIHHLVCKLTKYCDTPSEGYKNYTDNLLQLTPEDDAATQIISPRFRIPSVENYNELFEYTDHHWVNDNEYRGWKFISKTDPSIFIFFSESGCRFDNLNLYNSDKRVCGLDMEGLYWTSTINDYNPRCAMYMKFGLGDYDWPRIESIERHRGLTIRPITYK